MPSIDESHPSTELVMNTTDWEMKSETLSGRSLESRVVGVELEISGEWSRLD